MKNLTQKVSTVFFGAAMRVVTVALFLVIFSAGAALAQTRVYATNPLDNTVTVIDQGTSTVVTTIPGGTCAVRDSGHSKSGLRLRGESW